MGVAELQVLKWLRAGSDNSEMPTAENSIASGQNISFLMPRPLSRLKAFTPGGRSTKFRAGACFWELQAVRMDGRNGAPLSYGRDSMVLGTPVCGRPSTGSAQKRDRLETRPLGPRAATSG